MASSEDTVMHTTEADPAVVVPLDAARLAGMRSGLRALPTAPAQVEEGQQEIKMAEAEGIQEDKQENQNGQEADGDQDEDGGDAMDDLFGNDDDEEQGEQQQEAADEDEAAAAAEHDEQAAEGDEDALTAAELERRRRLEYEEGDDEEIPMEQQKIQYAQVKLAKLPMASEQHKQWHAKLPNFLNLESRPFDPTTFDPSSEPANIPRENTIRWRWGQPSPSSDPTSSSQPKKQSNARFVRWSDGSLSLQIGKEIFDVSTDRSISGRSLPPSGPVPLPPTSASRSSDATAYLVAQHGYAGLMESQVLVQGNMTFRPTAIQSSSHRRMAAKAAGLTQGKTNKVVMMMAERDPEAEKLARENALRGKKARAPKGEGAAKRTKRKSVRSTRLDDWSDAEGGSADDDMEAGGDSAALAAARKRQRAKEQEEMHDFLASESDEDEGASSDDPGRSRRARREEQEAELDDLDAMEARAEKAARRERGGKKKTASSRSTRDDSPDSEDLDRDEAFTKKKLVVESDDDE